jgi:phosphotransferase system enzyme I (PtsI)
MGDKQVIIRTLDIGADKKAEYMNLPEEENPAMGNRGIRVCLDRKKMFKTQLKAIYRASVYGNLSIMYPMISSMEEVREIKSIVKDVIKGLKKKEIPFKKVQHGIMVETPAAVMIAEDLAKEVDFLSLGTNDLSQYVLAMDRKNPSLKNKYNEHHPAILKMIKMTIDAAHSQGCWAGICGELGGDPEMTKTFLQMGVDVISVVPSGVLPLRKVIRETDLSC